MLGDVLAGVVIGYAVSGIAYIIFTKLNER